MPLSGAQIQALAAEIGAVWNVQTIRQFASDLLVTLDTTIDVNRTSGAVALQWVTWMNSRIPPRDGELLQALAAHPNARLRAIANRLLQPAWIPPTADALEAIALGRTAFVGRQPLRDELRKFLNPTSNSTRLLIVRGEQPCGKSYSFQFLRHFARNVLGGEAMRQGLRNCNFTPRQFLENVFALLGMAVDTTTMADDPQDVLVSPVLSAFKNQITTLSKTYFLIIDDINDPSVTREVRETAFALAAAIEEVRSDRLFVALLGYNQELDADYRNVAFDDATFPTPDFVAKFYLSMAKDSSKPLTPRRARVYADAAFSGFATIDKVAMTELTGIIETMGWKFSQGLRPDPRP